MFKAIVRNLQAKLILAFALAMLIPMATIAFYTDRTTSNSLVQSTRADESKIAEKAANAITSVLTDAQNSVLFLSETSAIKDYANLLDATRPSSDSNAISQAAAALFRSFLTNSAGPYRKVYILDVKGQLSIGVDNSVGALMPMTETESGSRANKAYFSQASKLLAGQAYVGGVELNTTNGKVDDPPVPIINYSTPIYDDFNGLAGVIVLEVGVQPLLTSLGASDEKDERVLLIDSDGSYLLHPDASMLYGRLLGTGALFTKDQPNDAGSILGSTDGDIFGSQDRPDLLQTFVKIAPFDQPAINWYLINQRPLRTILGSVNENRTFVVALSALLLLAAFALAAFLVRGIVGPIRALASTAQSIVVGDMTKHAEVKSKDEVGQLATAFNEMATAIQKRETDLRKQAEDLRKARDEALAATRLAQENTRLKSEFLSTMSHELRTPLNAIEGFTGIVLNKMGGTDYNSKTEGYLQRIRSNSKRLLQLINDFLDLSRIESGRLELANQPFSPVQLARRWQEEISVLAEKKGLQFEVNLASTLPEMIYGDEEAVSKVAINLLGNAIKFTEQGQVKLALERNDGKWEIIVEDTGIGIPPHARDFIFEEFRQVDQSSKRKYGGTGLGLAIVQKYTRAMGGSVNVKSELGRGSTFTVALPCKTSA